MRPLTSTNDSHRKRDFYEHFLVKRKKTGFFFFINLSFFQNNTGGDHFNSQAVNITYDEFFTKGFHILAWDRTPSSNNRFSRHMMDRGNISINLKTASVTSKKYQILMYSSYSDAIKLDGSTVTSSVTL